MQAQLALPLKGIGSGAHRGARVLHRLLGASPQLSLHGESSSQRRELETYIAGCFSRAYQAEVTEFAPLLLALNCAGGTGDIAGAAGIRPAGVGELFIEHYLDESVEQAVSTVFDVPVKRSEIAEIGNMAALRPGACQLIIFVLAAVLNRAGFRYAAFTGTEQMAATVRKYKAVVEPIASADPARLGKDAGKWGSYYASRPQVQILDLTASLQALQHQYLPAAVLSFYEPVIQKLSASLVAYNELHADSFCSD
jgi:hypothetical protein